MTCRFRLDLEAGIDEGAACLLGIGDQDVKGALPVTFVATGAFDVDARPPQGVARSQERAGAR